MNATPVDGTTARSLECAGRVITDHALIRRLQLESPHDQWIEQIPHDSDARKAIEAIMCREIGNGRRLSRYGRQVLQHPARKRNIRVSVEGHEQETGEWEHAPAHIHVATNTNGDFIWCGRLCYVVCGTVVVTAYHLTDEQARTLLEIERIQPVDVADNEAIPSELLRAFVADHKPKNDITPEVRAKHLPISSWFARRQGYRMMPSLPRWLTMPSSSLTILVVNRVNDTPIYNLVGWIRKNMHLRTAPFIHVDPSISVEIVHQLQRKCPSHDIEPVMLQVIPVIDWNRERGNQVPPQTARWWDQFCQIQQRAPDGRILLLLSPIGLRTLLEIVQSHSDAEWRSNPAILAPGSVVWLQWSDPRTPQFTFATY